MMPRAHLKNRFRGPAPIQRREFGARAARLIADAISLPAITPADGVWID